LNNILIHVLSTVANMLKKFSVRVWYTSNGPATWNRLPQAPLPSLKKTHRCY